MVGVVKTYLVNHQKIKKALLVFWEIAKWVFVLWLLFPIRKSMTERIDFARIVFGILLFVLFGGRVFYDSIFESYNRHSEKKPLFDVLRLFGIVSVIALVVGVTIVFIGYFIFTSLEQAAVQPE